MLKKQLAKNQATCSSVKPGLWLTAALSWLYQQQHPVWVLLQPPS